MTDIRIRKAEGTDFERIMEIYAQARKFMKENGNYAQWGDHYPPEALVRRDIAEGISYIAEADGEPEAVFAYFEGEDPTYQVIEDGSWLNNAPYGVIHRIAVLGRRRGVGSACIQWGVRQCGNLRMDTHADNRIMQHVLAKNGFVKCGRVYTEEGSPRIAYQCSICDR